MEWFNVSYFNLQHTLAASGSESGLLKLLELRVLHVRQVILPSREAIQHELHLGGDWRTNVEVLQRGSDAHDGQFVFTLRAGLEHKQHHHTLPQNSHLKHIKGARCSHVTGFFNKKGLLKIKRCHFIRFCVAGTYSWTYETTRPTYATHIRHMSVLTRL